MFEKRWNAQFQVLLVSSQPAAHASSFDHVFLHRLSCEHQQYFPVQHQQYFLEQYQQYFLMTRNQIRITLLSYCVTKILTLHGI